MKSPGEKSPPVELRRGVELRSHLRGAVPRLAALQVYVSMSGDSIRVSPHLYKTEADVDRLLEELDALV